MKSNEERVKSIMKKAKHYKSQREIILSITTCAICAVLSVVVGTTFKNNSLNSNTDISNENLNVAMLNNEEKEVCYFSSEDELIKLLSENAQKHLTDLRYELVEDYAFEVANDTLAIAGMNNANEQSKTSTDEFSKTNTQVQDVDEADIVKTNGKRIFYLNSKDNRLEIFDTQADELKLDKEVKFDDNIVPIDIYLDDKYIVVIASSRISSETENVQSKSAYLKNKSTIKALIYDVNTYEYIREIETEGILLSSRKVEDDIYIITNKYLYYYDDIIRENVLPIYKDTSFSQEYTNVAAQDIAYFDDFRNDNECNYMIITSFNLNDMDKKANVSTYLGAGNEVYCSRNNLYVAKKTYARDSLSADTAINNDSSYTNIHKFSINSGKINHIATGKVPGRLLNQFSMDEYDDNFRITTTLSNAGNNLYVLDKDMKQIGSIENLASGEKIYSTRFMGNKAYVVTYKTVDPLFVIDLTNPVNPKVLGELKIPGYSSYLHPLDENHLIGFGKDSVEKSYLNWEGNQEVVAYSTGLKMSIFDVSDYSKPKEMYTIKIGGRGSDSQLLHNHKSLLFNEKEGIIAFPASITSEAGNYDNGVPKYGEVIFKGALVYDISVENGISLRGKISHNTADVYDEEIKRIIYIGDKLYTISDEIIKSSDINTIEEISELKF